MTLPRLFHLTRSFRFLTLALLWFCLFHARASAQAPVNLWSGNGNALDSNGDRNGEILGQAGYSAGKYGQAFQLSGSGCVRSLIDPSFRLSSYSLEAWVRPVEGLAEGDPSFIFGQPYGFGHLLLQNAQGRLVPRLTFLTKDHLDQASVVSSNAIELNVYTHLVGTWDEAGQSLAIWVNGKLAGQSATTLEPFASGDPLLPFFIGGYYLLPNSPGQFFKGGIDEVAFYDRALPASEIQARYLASQGPPAPQQIIVFGPIPNHYASDPSFAPQAFASSRLPVVVEVVSGPASIMAGKIAVNGPGTVVVRASQGGNADYEPAPPVVVSFEVLPNSLNQPPVVHLISPVFGSVFYEGRPIVFQAEASDPEGKVAKVEFYEGGNLLATVLAAPFKFEISTLAAGTHSIVAKVTDGAGNVAISAPVNVPVLNDPANPFGKWTVRREKPFTAGAQLRPVKKVVIGNGLFVALQGLFSNLDVYHATRELRWLPTDGSLPSPTRDIAFGNGLFVAVGDYDKVYTSADAVAWTARTVPEAAFGLLTCSYANGYFLCVGPGAVYSSRDALTWERTPLTGAAPPGDIIYGNGIYLSLDGAFKVYLSTDFTHWTDTGASAGGPTIFALGKFYSTCATSPDGLRWTSYGSCGAFKGIAYAEASRTLVRVGATSVPVFPWLVTSQDGENWTTRPAPLNLAPSGQGLDFIAAGEGWLMTGGVVDQSAHLTATLISEDGLVWRHGEAAAPNLNAVAHGPSGYVAVGNNGVLLNSTDGSNWAEVSGLPNHHLFNVCQANGTYVAVGEAGLILVSQNGRDWAIRPTGASLNLHGIAYGAGKFVVTGADFEVPLDPVRYPAMGGSVSLYSTNGVDWLTGSSNALSVVPYSVIWDGKRFVVDGYTSQYGPFGYYGWIYASTSGVSDWVQILTESKQDTPYVLNAQRLEYGNGRVAFASPNFGVLTNLDQQYATYISVRAATTTGLGFGNGLFVAMTATNAWASADGLAWRSYDLPTTVPLYDVAYGDGAYVAVGANQTIIQSTLQSSAGIRLASPSRVGAGFAVSVPSEFGLRYFLERKDSLSDPSWQPFPYISGKGSPLLLQDTNSPGASRFYRVRVE